MCISVVIGRLVMMLAGTNLGLHLSLIAMIMTFPSPYVSYYWEDVRPMWVGCLVLSLLLDLLILGWAANVLGQRYGPDQE
jgi:hypothetical protein